MTSGPDLDRCLEDERLALLGLDDLDVGVREGQDRLLDERVTVGRLDEPIDGLVEDGTGAEDSLEDRPRRLSRPEAGDTGSSAECSDGLVDGAAEALGGDFDLEDDGTLWGRGGSDVHRRGSIGRAACAGRRWCGMRIWRDLDSATTLIEMSRTWRIRAYVIAIAMGLLVAFLALKDGLAVWLMNL